MLTKYTNVLRLIASVSILALMAGAASAETLRLAHHHPVGGAVDQAAKKFAELTREKTSGALTIQVFPAAQLGQEREAFDLVEQGGLDISITTTSFLDKVYPAVAVTTMPFVFRDWDHARAAYSGEFGELIRSSVSAASTIEVLAYYGIGFRQFFFTADEPATTVAQMNGLKMRSPENYSYVRMFELLGARPTPITFGEVYTAMQTGVAQGFESPAGVVLDSKLNEVAGSALQTNHMFTAMVFAMNENSLARLPQEQQALLQEAAREATQWAETEITIPAEAATMVTFSEGGMVIAQPAVPEEWPAAVKPMVDELAASVEGAADLLAALAAAE